MSTNCGAQQCAIELRTNGKFWGVPGEVEFAYVTRCNFPGGAKWRAQLRSAPGNRGPSREDITGLKYVQASLPRCNAKLNFPHAKIVAFEEANTANGFSFTLDIESESLSFRERASHAFNEVFGNNTSRTPDPVIEPPVLKVKTFEEVLQEFVPNVTLS